MKILICGLSGSGKTTLAKALEEKLEYCFHLNADEVREKYNDWDFSPEGRIRQAKRMSSLADELLYDRYLYVICDFICPTSETRELVSPDYIIYMDTIDKSIYEDTDKGTNYSGFKADANTTASVAYQLPAADGTSGFQLTTDGSGVLSWASAGTTLANDANNRVVTGTGSGLNLSLIHI